MQSSEFLSPELLAELVQGRVDVVECVTETGSTNDDLKSAVQSGRHAGRCVLRTAERQNAGRGTRGRTWANANEALLFSVSMPWTASERIGGLISLAAGEGVARAAHALRIAAALKWPNDIWAAEGKAGGILCEFVRSPDGVPHLVVGIGLNLRVKAAGRTTHGWRITSLVDAGARIDGTEDRTSLLASVVTGVVDQLRRLAREGGKVVVDDWPLCDAFGDRTVAWVEADGARVEIGRIRGIDEAGFLLVEGRSGRTTLGGGAALCNPLEFGYDNAAH